MKRLIAPLLLILFCLPAHAAHVKLFGSVEGYGGGGMSEAYQKDTQSAVNALRALGVASAGSVTTSTPGIGARVGFLVAQDKGWDVGGSFGFVDAPRVKEVVMNGPFAGFNFNGETDIKTNTYFLRYLLEGGKTVRLFDKASLRLGAGLGVAMGFADQGSSTSGSAAAILAGTTRSESWLGLTWEVGPSLIIPIGTAELETGARYSQFPTKGETADFSKIKWNPVSWFLAVRFAL